ncbi:MAG: hypothetical protein ACLRZL_06475 [Alistipes communis]
MIPLSEKNKPISRKNREIFADSEIVATFAPAIRKSTFLSKSQVYSRKPAAGGNGGSKLQKFLENYLVDSKKGFTFAPLSAPKTGGEVLKKLRKKSSSKIWWIRKKVLPLHHFPLRK